MKSIQKIGLRRGMLAACLGISMASSIISPVSYAAESTCNSPDVIGKMVGKTTILDAQTIEHLIAKGEETFRHLIKQPVSTKDSVDLSSLELQETFMRLASLSSEGAYSSWAGYMPSMMIRGLLASPDMAYHAKRKEMLCGIISLAWYFQALATAQGEGFERGSLTMLDQDEKVYRFLHSYVGLVNGVDEPEKLPYLTTTSNYAYRREPTLWGSSHHVFRSPESQFGIDIRLEANQGVLKLLPGDHTHILFGNIRLDSAQTAPTLFFKTEEIGMGNMASIAAHAFNFGWGKKVTTDDRREKDILSQITAVYDQLLAITGEEKKKGVTMRDMVLQAQEHLKQGGDIQAQAQALLDKVLELYPNGNHDFHVGNEVVIDLSKACGMD